jgi:hypothetical protein
MGATHGEPGHALTGTTYLHAHSRQPEIPAMVYVTEISHLEGNQAYAFGGGTYRRARDNNALVGSGPERWTRTRVVPLNPTAIDTMLVPRRPITPSRWETACFSPRAQVFVSRRSWPSPADPDGIRPWPASLIAGAASHRSWAANESDPRFSTASVGAMPDVAAVRPQDEGANTLGTLVQNVGGLRVPALLQLGLGQIVTMPQAGVSGSPPLASYGRCHLAHAGADTYLGHQEIMGTITPPPIRTLMREAAGPLEARLAACGYRVRRPPADLLLAEEADQPRQPEADPQH